MQEKRVVAEMPLMKVRCEMKSSGVSRAEQQTLCMGKRAVPVVFHGLGAGAQDHG